MTSSFSYATAATLEHEPLCVLNDHRKQEGCSQPVSDQPTYCIRAAGVLRYNRESDNQRINFTTVLPAPPALAECAVKCEYCGEKARPSLGLTWLQEPETTPLFCCAQWQQLCVMLVRQRCLFEGRCDLKTGTPTSLEDKPSSGLEELLFKGREMQKHNKFMMDLPGGLGTQSELRIHEDYSVHLPVAETFAPTSKVLSFRLSCAPGKGSLTIYPSGILALVVVVTKENGRVCIVYDDSDTPNQPIRAVFQSDGRAACYHSNGNIWLSLNRSGGQCLDEAGARVRRWSWSSVSLTPTPLHPVFLSLNKTVGVRVLGKEQVFVSFLAQGQQAKFSVGTCCAQGESKTDGAAPGPSVMKEELFVLAARTRIHLVIQHLHQYLMTPSHPQLPKTTQAPHLHVVAQKLLEVSAHVTMNDRERAFIQKCLQDLSTP
ncbi:glutamate-rich protein 6-like isoform X3 [Seriola dumerili]|uniref:glutamate-rich protein 6-like isoform X3 n=1 Tax=Seriola dumerili TaxID=41447 RepID=UPI000BBECB4B|nr:glutamate-rich protein 6-like isoform X3 [Seriola dumerili]